MLSFENVVAWFNFEFAGHEIILNKLAKPPTMRLSPKQNSIVVAFARSHYDRIGGLVVHQLMKNNIGRKTLVSNKDNKCRYISPFFPYI